MNKISGNKVWRLAKKRVQYEELWVEMLSMLIKMGLKKSDAIMFHGKVKDKQVIENNEVLEKLRLKMVNATNYYVALKHITSKEIELAELR